MFDQGTFDAMIHHGPRFTRKLAEAWRVADEEEAAALMLAFPYVFAIYRMRADEDRARAMIEKAVVP